MVEGKIAYHIKAMLEQAEVAISGVNNLINVPEVIKDNFDTVQQKKILLFYKRFFLNEDLPTDLVRLCKNTNELLKALSIKVNDLSSFFLIENHEGRGTNFKNLSPFLLVIQSIINQRPDLIREFIERVENQKFKIIIPKELVVSQISLERENNIVKI